MQADVIIVGGGIAGLASATELGRSGLRVVVVEADVIAGGRARSWNDPHSGDTVDIGPHILLSEYRNMLHWLGALGTRGQIVWQDKKFLTLVDKPHRIDIRMHNLPAPLHFLPSMVGIPGISLAELLSNRKLMWRVIRLKQVDLRQLDTVTAEAYLRQCGVSERFIDWFWRTACMTIMNVPLQNCSAAALLNFFRYMIGKRGYQVGFAGAGLGDLYVDAATRCIEAAGGRVLLRTQVRQVVSEDERLLGVQLSDGTLLQARFCIAAVPPPALLPLLPASWRDARPEFKGIKGFEPSPYISTWLWFDRKLSDSRFWTRVWNPANLNYDSYDLSNIRAGWSARPSVIASNIIHSTQAERLSDDQIITATLREIADFAPEAREARLLHSRVHRIPMAVPLATTGSEQRRPENVTSVKGLLLAGDWTRTGLPPSMESATRSGFLAAEQVLEQFERPRRIAQPLPEAESLVRLLGGP